MGVRLIICPKNSQQDEFYPAGILPGVLSLNKRPGLKGFWKRVPISSDQRCNFVCLSVCRMHGPAHDIRFWCRDPLPTST